MAYIFMSFAEIKKAINSNLNKTLDALITEKASSLSTGISDNKAILNNSTYGLSALKSAMSGMTGGNVPVVKKVQSGTVNYGTTTTRVTTPKLMSYAYTYYIDIAISSVNTSKAIVLIDSINPYSSGVELGRFVPVLTSSTNLRIYVSGDSQPSATASTHGGFSWQVIEFY